LLWIKTGNAQNENTSSGSKTAQAAALKPVGRIGYPQAEGAQVLAPAVHFTYMRAVAPGIPRQYSYGGMAYSNPDAPTQIANGLSTSTFAYDNDGNLIQKTTDGTTTTYAYDYANRLIALGVSGATTTYGYDAFGTRVLQTGTSTTNIYPFKWVSVASSTGSGAQFATTTDYVFNGDTLVATVDQETASGNATGTPATHYIHPDHLGSTNVVTNASGTVEQTLDYFPYGGTRVSTGQNAESRQYIGQFADQSNLDYLNARYYEGSRGQFLSVDPTFLAVGTPKLTEILNRVNTEKGSYYNGWEKDQKMSDTLALKRFLSDPQLMNSYGYGRDNPIVNKDPTQSMVRLRWVSICGTPTT
jgi:RHS repeat-associated protein